MLIAHPAKNSSGIGTRMPESQKAERVAGVEISPELRLEIGTTRGFYPLPALSAPEIVTAGAVENGPAHPGDRGLRLPGLASTISNSTTLPGGTTARRTRIDMKVETS